jgi:hypothetical protein
MLDLIRLSVAILPLAAYFQVLGLIRLRSRPTLLSGATDFFLLAIAMMGLIAIGPIELFFPRAAYAILGPWVWGVLFALYFFVIMLVALNSKFKLIAYGLDSESLKQTIQDGLSLEQMEAYWGKDIVEIPALGLRASIEKAGVGKTASLEAIGQSQNPMGWYTMEKLIANNLKPNATTQTAEAFRWIALSLILFGISAAMIAQDLPRLKKEWAILFEPD